MTNQSSALEKVPKDDFLALVEKIIENPEVSAEKLEVLVNLQIKLEDRRAKKEYDAAMIKVRPQIKAVAWDKIGAHSSRYASYPKIDQMLTPILDEHGLAISFDTEPDPRPNMMIGCCDVMHIGGHTKRHRLPMPIDGSGPKDSGVMSSQQAVKSGVSYFIRTFVGMIFAIPMLVDKDDNDGNPIRTTVTEAQVTELRKLFDRLSEPRQKKALEHFKLDVPDKEPLHTALANLQARGYNNALKALAGALRNDNTVTITDEQEATLTALIEDIGGNCKADFLKANKIKKVNELAASQYQGALAGLQQQRRK